MLRTTPTTATVVLPSHSGGEAHTVTLTVSKRAGVAGPAGTAYTTCTCAAFTLGFRRCWASLQVASAFSAVSLGR